MQDQFSRARIARWARLAAWLVVLGALAPRPVLAQEDAPSLGELARNLRQKKAQDGVQEQKVSSAPLIDNDNLTQALQDVRRMKAAEKVVFSVDPDGKGLRLTSPDINCSLAFNGRNSSVQFRPVLVEDLPLADVLKLDGPASIQEDTLQLEVTNSTEWELREITVGLTLERSAGTNAEVAARARVIPAAENSSAVTVERRSDMTLLFHLKADAKPFSTAIFRENIGITPTADEDWRWSIVGAKGVRVDARTNAPEPLPAAPQLPLPSPSIPSNGVDGAKAPAPDAKTPAGNSPQPSPQSAEKTPQS